MAWIKASQWPGLEQGQAGQAGSRPGSGQWPGTRPGRALAGRSCHKEKGYEKEEEAAVVGLLTVGWSGQKKCVSCLLGRGCYCMLFELSDLQPFLAQVFCLGGLEESQMIDR